MMSLSTLSIIMSLNLGENVLLVQHNSNQIDLPKIASLIISSHRVRSKINKTAVMAHVGSPQWAQQCIAYEPSGPTIKTTEGVNSSTFYIVGRPLIRDVEEFTPQKFRLPIGRHSSCNISPTARGI